MKNIKTFQGTEERLNGNVGAGLNKVVCVVIVLILIVLVCVGGFFWYKHSKNLSVNELIGMGLQVGDYVSYVADIDKSADWRVWKIEEDNVVIVPTEPLGDLNLGGAEDWLNAEEKIENECDKYVNSSLGITAEEIRSMKIEDIEEVFPEEYVESVKLDDDYGKEYSYESGTFYAEKADTDTFDGYNKELNTPKTANSNSPVKLVNTGWDDLGVIYLPWQKLKNTKTGMTSDTYGTILGHREGWLASRCVNYDSISAAFRVRDVDDYGVGYYSVYNSVGSAYSGSGGVRPLVSLNTELFNKEGNGTLSNPWQLGEKIESEEIEGTNGVAGGNLSGNELVGMGLQVGDYVSYATDINKIADWRVWRIEGDNVIIVPTKALGDLTLGGGEDWLNAEEKIESECDKYVNSNLGITTEEIRSMKIEDIEEVMPEEVVESAKLNNNYGKEYSYEFGIFYAEKADTDTFDGYNKELSTPKPASSSNSVKLVNTVWNVSPTWNKLENTKTGMTDDTYGTILGNTFGWLASRGVNCNSRNYAFGVDQVIFGVSYVWDNDVSYVSVYTSTENKYEYKHGVRPLVSLSSKLFTGEGEGTSSNPWQLNG